jgi:Cu/Ag efflux pump CusA
MAVNPGPGSVIYRGLAAVIVGGIVVSMVFSLLLLPSLMRLMAGWRNAPAEASALADSRSVPRAA